jgi:hypothetical protein
LASEVCTHHFVLLVPSIDFAISSPDWPACPLGLLTLLPISSVNSPKLR